MSLVRSLFSDRNGSAAVELMLCMPILLVLIFGSFELGNFFLSEHVVQKAVRDAARYAARLPMTNYPSCTVPAGGTAEQGVQKLARTGTPTGTLSRLPGWTADNMTTLAIRCDTTSSYGTGGIYADFPNGAPVVTVSAAVTYSTFFGSMGLGATTLTLHAQSEAAVIGA